MPTFFRSDGWVKATTGAAIPGAQIYVATQPANVAFAPPTPLATIYSDPNGLVPITQPILTDGFGHYDFYVLPGTYTVVVALGGVIQQVYPDQSIGLGGGSTSGTVTSVDMTVPNILSVSGNPITVSGTLALSLATQAANKVFAGPTSGGSAVPTFRSLVSADLPTISIDNLQGVSVSNATPRIGDTLRYNENGDSKWDVVQGIPKYYSCYSCLSTITSAQGYTVNITGAGTTPTTVGTQASVIPTATEPVFQNSSRAASSDVGNIAVGVIWPQQGGPSGSITFGTLRRYQVRCRLNNLSSIRYWVAMVEFQSTIATSFLHTDTPNGPYVGFRFSAGTDTTIKAVAGTASAAQTVTDTGISVDTVNSQLFDIVYTSTSVFYYINGSLVATISTNLPTASTGLIGCVVGDNKSTATAMSLDFAHMIFTVK